MGPTLVYVTASGGAVHVGSAKEGGIDVGRGPAHAVGGISTLVSKATRPCVSSRAA